VTWTRTPQEYPDRADVLAVPRSARWLLIEMYSWANAQLTNGRVPRAVLRRISDSEDLIRDVDALIREGLLVEDADGALWLDWSNQEDAETVTTRAARNADKTKRARERKERHLAGDHSMCVAPYCKLGTITPVTGNTEGNVTGKQKGNATGKRTGMLTPLQSSPVQSSPYEVKGLVLDRAGADSAGATSVPASGGRLNAEMLARPAVVTLADLPEVMRRPDMTQEELDYFWHAIYADPESERYGTWAPPADADTLDGLIPAGGADR